MPSPQPLEIRERGTPGSCFLPWSNHFLLVLLLVTAQELASLAGSDRAPSSNGFTHLIILLGIRF
jgi:hypothetical protein